MPSAFVAIVMGSESDLGIVRVARETLDALGVASEMRITSAHRTPDATHAYIKDADARGCAVFIAAAGMAAHLAGTVAALTTKPVIGIPLDSGSLGGLDALLSTVQMPGGVPVACVAIGKAGAKNAAMLAAQIVALNNAEVAARLAQARQADTARVLESDRRLQGDSGAAQ